MELYNELKQFGRIKLNESLSKHTTFKIGGPADFLVLVDQSEKMVKLVNLLNSEGINYFIIGGGSNVLFSDEGFRGVVIKFNDRDFKIKDNFAYIQKRGVIYAPSTCYFSLLS